jgi:hypothetical protein
MIGRFTNDSILPHVNVTGAAVHMTIIAERETPKIII